MNSHKNAPLTPKGREAMVRSVVEGGLSQADAAYQFNTTPAKPRRMGPCERRNDALMGLDRLPYRGVSANAARILAHERIPL